MFVSTPLNERPPIAGVIVQAVILRSPLEFSPQYFLSVKSG
jgi:hypothetical protein